MWYLVNPKKHSFGKIQEPIYSTKTYIKRPNKAKPPQESVLCFCHQCLVFKNIPLNPCFQLNYPVLDEMIKNSSFKMLEPRRLHRIRLQQLFSTISLVAIFYMIIFADSFISDISVHFFDSSKPISHHAYLHNRSLVVSALKSTSSIGKQVRLVKEVVEEAYFEDHSPVPVPPFNLTTQQRIIWFKKKLPEFEILKSTGLTKQFEKRVKEFLGKGCKVQFFMTWISPARKFEVREFLAMESLFKENPDSCLMILSRTLDSVRGLRILKPLLDRQFKVQAVTPNLSFLFKNTPAESWFNHIRKGNKDPGEIPLAQNLSNLIRLAILYKYGGVYLDTDFIVLRDFSGLRNSIGAQSTDLSGNWTRLNNAVLVFDKSHPLLHSFMKEFAFTFDGNRWGHNGPYLVSRVVEREAKRSNLNFTVVPPMTFYPVDWRRIESLFLRPVNRNQQRWVDAKLLQLNGATYGVHLWNKQSRKLEIEEGSIIDRLISKQCVICNHVYSS